MNVARTQIGLVEWARRARWSVGVCLAAADALGTAVAATDDVVRRLELLDRARRYGWCAEQWDVVVPVLHDVALDDVTTIAYGDLDATLGRLRDSERVADAAAAEELLRRLLVGCWRTWACEAAPVADTPFALVLDRVARELEPETVL